MRDLIEALGAIADGMRDAGEHEDAAILDRAAAALEAAREDSERAMDGLRYSALVWALSDEIEQSPETVDSAVRRMIRGGAEFRRTGHHAFPAIDQARGKGVAE